jgi:hypothetical protein
MVPWKLLELQGINRTWYVGAIASFETMENVVDYNHMIADLYLPEKSE